MKTVKEVSQLTGVSIRTLHYYDSIGLLPPAEITDSGYRLYDNTSLSSLQTILLFRELEFPLREIKRIINSPDFNREDALKQQIELLTSQRDRLTELIAYAKKQIISGGHEMDFSAFDRKKLDEYSRAAKEKWGNTEAFIEFEKKEQQCTVAEREAAAAGLMGLFSEFGKMRSFHPEDECVQLQVAKLRSYITDNFYSCTLPILSGLGEMYSAEGEMAENIDRAGGKGTAALVSNAIAVYCMKN